MEPDQIGQVGSPGICQEETCLSVERGLSRPPYRRWPIMAVGLPEIVSDSKAKDGQDQIASAVDAWVHSQLASSKLGSSLGTVAWLKARAIFQAVRGRNGWPRRVAARVGRETFAWRESSDKLHPRAMQAAFSRAGSMTTTRSGRGGVRL